MNEVDLVPPNWILLKLQKCAFEMLDFKIAFINFLMIPVGSIKSDLSTTNCLESRVVNFFCRSNLLFPGDSC